MYVAKGYSTYFPPCPLAAMLSSIKQGAAKDGAHKYGSSTHLYSWVEKGIICVNTLPKDAVLECGHSQYRTHDLWIMSPMPMPPFTQTVAEWTSLKDSENFK